MLNLVKIKPSYVSECKKNDVDKEIMVSSAGRPCVLLMKLKYRGELRDFVVPLRSNISPSTPKEQYFALPNNKGTKMNHHHGIHYIKILPVSSKHLDKFQIEGDQNFNMIHNIINKSENKKAIIDACQTYLKEYENGKRHPMTPDIDGIIKKLGL